MRGQRGQSREATSITRIITPRQDKHTHTNAYLRRTNGRQLHTTTTLVLVLDKLVGMLTLLLRLLLKVLAQAGKRYRVTAKVGGDAEVGVRCLELGVDLAVEAGLAFRSIVLFAVSAREEWHASTSRHKHERERRAWEE